MGLKSAKKYVLLLVLICLSACSKSGDPVPVPIYPEEDVCETCRMLIADQRFAAECVMKKGRVKKFDDTICMVRYFDMSKTLGTTDRDDVRAYFVKDYDTKEWLDASKAQFVKANVTTVMGYGMLAFRERECALHFVQQYQGKLLSFEEIWEVFKQPNAEREIAIKNNIMTPDVVSVKFGDLVEIRLNIEDDNDYNIVIRGYEADGVFPPASKGHPALLRLNAVRPGTDFAFIDQQTNTELGRFRVEGAHFSEEMKKR